MQDVVETHLLRDIAARSENFFQAASVVQDLRGVLARTYIQVKALRKQVSPPSPTTSAPPSPVSQTFSQSKCHRALHTAAAKHTVAVLGGCANIT